MCVVTDDVERDQKGKEQSIFRVEIYKYCQESCSRTSICHHIQNCTVTRFYQKQKGLSHDLIDQQNRTEKTIDRTKI
jgi:hypothetical protein